MTGGNCLSKANSTATSVGDTQAYFTLMQPFFWKEKLNNNSRSRGVESNKAYMIKNIVVNVEWMINKNKNY